MPNIESLLQTISRTLSYSPHDTAYSITNDWQYAYSQIILHPDTASRCNFNHVIGNMTGTYILKTGF